MRTGSRAAVGAFVLACAAIALPAPAAGPPAARHRLVVLSDIEADPDDTQSFVRLLLYSNQIDLEAASSRGIAVFNAP